MSTPLDLNALQAICDAATPGPWRAGSVEREKVFCPHDGIGPERVVATVNPYFPEAHIPDAALIAMAREAMPALIAELREARASLEKLPHHCGGEACQRRSRGGIRLCDCSCDGCVDAEDHGIFVHKKAVR